ncbi:DUF4227 family protein [Paenibacillus crassostreae]|uniref:DUF4227 domain-containing protein n=1 Tax=Paenibacillus crassostreae TaxID=1763538 RepID=A0A167DIE9_9BACL|nr:DUF4227 family protein [Paenibacillus crassostreae]AOZ91429.1 hypothetical protein LPB68_03880 [Paenibacillus crassostreae]OAB74412.1 hypothetical protein PNBC_10080 [Paenibacillus crassostreae]
MVISLRKWLNSIRFVVIFLALAYLLFCILNVLGDWINPVDPYSTPKGYAIKAFQLKAGDTDGELSMGERLRVFYWYGE